MSGKLYTFGLVTQRTVLLMLLLTSNYHFFDNGVKRDCPLYGTSCFY